MPSPPFWRGTSMREDPLFFIDDGGGRSIASLLFPVSGAFALGSASGDLAFERGRDFVLDADAGLVIRTPASRIPLTTRDELYPSSVPDGGAFMFKRDAPGSFLMFSEDALFHRRRVGANYTHRAGLWQGHVPKVAAMARTQRLLAAGAPLTIAVTGDSISEGYNASGFLGVAPGQPGYVDLVVAGLRAVSPSPLALHNYACAGWTADQGLADVARVGEAAPDLVIVAFGMNDSGYAAAGEFAGNIAGIMADVRRAAPEAEFVLVAPMLPNPEWHYPVMTRFAEYRQALEDLCGPGVSLADVTRMWGDLLVRKSVYDLTGNGINHPNDFGHRVYADVILALLLD